MSVEAASVPTIHRRLFSELKQRPQDGAVPQSPLIRGFERFFLFFAFTCFTGVTAFGSKGVTGDTASNPVNLTCNAIILSIVVTLIAMRWREMVPLLWRSSPILLLAAWALCSVSWSIDPPVSFRRVGTMVLCVMVAYYVVMRIDMPTIIRILGYSFLGVAVASTFVALVFPGIGIMNDPSSMTFNAWRGVMPVKNNLGWITFGGVQVYAWRALFEHRKRVMHIAIILFFTFVAYKSKSDTAMLSIPLSIIVLPIMKIRWWKSVGRVWIESIAVMACIAVTVVVSAFFGDLLTAIGKDPTLTGRVPLWHAAIRMMELKPWLGYGYYAFWIDSNPAFHWVAMVAWEAPDAHNAYIDLGLELGLPGAILGTSILLSLLFMSVRLCRTSREPWVIYAAMFTIVFAITNLVDTRLFRSGDPFCFIMALCYFAVMKLKIEQREKAKAESDEMKKHWSWRLARGRNLAGGTALPALPSVTDSDTDTVAEGRPQPSNGGGLKFRSVSPR